MCLVQAVSANGEVLLIPQFVLCCSWSEGKMAPVTTIETITISRPLKVIAFICGCFASILLIMGLASTEWLLADRYRQGLFLYCVEKNSSNVPFVPENGERATEGCHRIDWNIQGYTVVAAAFCAISFLVDLFATILTALGLRCRDPNRKYKYYRTAVYVMALSLVAVLVALVIYPVCFAQIMEKSQRPVWEFGWAYGVTWGASIFLFGGVILLLCDKESEELYYKERTITYAESNNKV
ncbi:transmembrane protein 47 isoform X3 [Folsomia candida]|uniref:transmembrane protein 47 isoform X3 n=1 Tax=Folsomia candida TaxID=158441 RepID=UPI00160558F5|nr:transmembrane protein 47 isoform X3 [Folsomia candida]